MAQVKKDGEWITVTEQEKDLVRQGDQILRLDPYTREYRPL